MPTRLFSVLLVVVNSFSFEPYRALLRMRPMRGDDDECKTCAMRPRAFLAYLSGTEPRPGEWLRPIQIVNEETFRQSLVNKY